ncbi:protein lin-7 homolog C-like [Sycon ciliatum]|uniref:protein lin-7 homolog C-like n=1 Tax=Sycon ciliatum TaxID=27933 RepID=UPI0031F67606
MADSSPSSDLRSDVARLQELLQKRSNGSEGKNFKALNTILQRAVDGKLVETYCKVNDHVAANQRMYPDQTVEMVTTAAYATATGYAEPRIVDIKRGDSGYGFNIMGGNAVGMPIYVSRILPGGVAARQGQLKKGDQILSINGQAIRGMSHEDMVRTMRHSQSSVRIVVSYAPHLLDGMEKTFETQRRISAKRHQEKRMSSASGGQ